MNNVFRLVNPVHDMDTYTFKVHVFKKQAKCEQNTVFVSSFRVFNIKAQSSVVLSIGKLEVDSQSGTGHY